MFRLVVSNEYRDDVVPLTQLSQLTQVHLGYSLPARDIPALSFVHLLYLRLPANYPKCLGSSFLFPRRNLVGRPVA